MIQLSERILKLDEEDEVYYLNLMKDIDEMLENYTRLYPNNSWTRTEFLHLYFSNSMDNRLNWILQELQS